MSHADILAAPSSSLRAARRATNGFFLLSGIATGAWAPMVPFAKSRLGLDEAQLGLLLLCMGAGSAGSMPLAGFFSHRFGNRHTLLFAGLVVCAGLPLLTVATSPGLLGAALVLFGGSLGVVDVAMNAHAVDVERLYGRPVMSSFHALYSLGGLAGSAGMSVLLGAGASLVGCGAAVGVLAVAIVVSQWPRLIAAPRDEAAAQRSAFTAPSGRTILLGLLCMAVFLAEGAMLDWSAVLLRAARDVAISDAGLGYAAFSIAMATGRLFGDRITAELGPSQVVRYGSLAAAAGFALASALPWAETSVIGFTLVGFGASNIVPVLFSAAGRIRGTTPGMAIATVTALGYAGMLAGPAVIGVVARVTTLPLALGGVGLLLAGVSSAASIARAREMTTGEVTR
ncbi:MAG TPA: MFS transporter [Kofleriaceae bacterium]|nr:MFS transporter [Kofleriaceae bacterium]